MTADMIRCVTDALKRIIRWRKPPMVFGMELVLDIDGCDPTTLDDHDALERFAADIVKRLNMRAYGPAQLPHFGHDDPVTAGYTLIQLIETSSIVGHFSPHLRRAHLNLFSCKAFDPDDAATFCAQFFRGKVGRRVLIVR